MNDEYQELQRFLNRFWSKVEITPDVRLCWNWTGKISSRGYGRFYTSAKEEPAHRVAWCLFHKQEWTWKNQEMVIDHVCRNPACVNPYHLRLLTQKENTRAGMNINNNWSRGDRRKNSKLTDEMVRQIREEYGSGVVTCKDLAPKYGVSPTMISLIIRKAKWKHVS